MPGATPERHLAAVPDATTPAGELDRYFAMARGTADAPPLEMTKWFAATVKLTSAFRQPSIKAAIRAVDLGKSELDPLGTGLVQSAQSGTTWSGRSSGRNFRFGQQHA